jgi:hypothetical protein
MKRLLLSVSLCLALVAVAANVPAQTQKGSSPDVIKGQGEKVTMHGKIEFMKTMGGYFLNTENPHQEMIIVNQNPKMLEGFQKSGKKVTVKGHLTTGAEFLFIESIDGKPYKAEKGPAKKK